MVMALGAGDVGAKEDGHRVREVVQGHAGVAQQIASGTIVPHLAVCGEHVGNHLIPGTVGFDLSL